MKLCSTLGYACSVRIALVAVGLLLLVGCSQDTSDLQSYIQQVKAQKPAPLEPIPEMKPFETFLYPEELENNPFEPFGRAREQENTVVQDGPRPDPNRPTEVLEEFALDALRMVGTMNQGGLTWGLVRDSEGTVHRVLEGNYMGKNHGRIVSIAESEIELVELVPNGQGGWRERAAALALPESN